MQVSANARMRLKRCRLMILANCLSPDHCHVTDQSDCWRQEDCPIACINSDLSRKFF
jgi:hypothetical protein